DRQIELATDHEQCDRDGEDAERRGRLEPRGGAGARAERCAAGEREEQPDEEQRSERRELRRDEQSLHRIPCAVSSMTAAASSRVTIPGPVRISSPPPGMVRVSPYFTSRMTGR